MSIENKKIEVNTFISCKMCEKLKHEKEFATDHKSGQKVVLKKVCRECFNRFSRERYMEKKIEQGYQPKTERTCTKCNLALPIDDFPPVVPHKMKDGTLKYYRRSVCVNCRPIKPATAIKMSQRNV